MCSCHGVIGARREVVYGDEPEWGGRCDGANRAGAACLAPVAAAHKGAPDGGRIAAGKGLLSHQLQEPAASPIFALCQSDWARKAGSLPAVVPFLCGRMRERKRACFQFFSRASVFSGICGAVPPACVQYVVGLVEMPGIWKVANGEHKPGCLPVVRLQTFPSPFAWGGCKLYILPTE